MKKYIALLLVSTLANILEMLFKILDLYCVRYITIFGFVAVSIAFIVYDKVKKNSVVLSSGALVLVSVLFIFNVAIGILSDLLLTAAEGIAFFETVNSISCFGVFVSLYLLCNFFMNLINIRHRTVKIILYAIISVNLIVLLIRTVAVLFGIYIGNNFT